MIYVKNNKARDLLERGFVLYHRNSRHEGRWNKFWLSFGGVLSYKLYGSTVMEEYDVGTNTFFTSYPNELVILTPEERKANRTPCRPSNPFPSEALFMATDWINSLGRGL